MVFSKRILVALAVSTLFMSSGAYADLESNEDPWVDNGNIANNGGGGGGLNSSLGNVDFSQIWAMDPAALKVITDALAASSASNTLLIDDLTTALATADADGKVAIQAAINDLKAQNVRIKSIGTDYATGAALYQALQDDIAALQGGPLTAQQQMTIQARIDAANAQLASLEAQLASTYSAIQTAQNTIDAAAEDYAALMGGGGGKIADATAAASDAADARASALADRDALLDTLRAGSAGDGGRSTKVTEGRATRTAASRRANIGYTLE